LLIIANNICKHNLFDVNSYEVGTHSMASIELRSLHKSYGDGLTVIRDVNLQIKQGEFCVFVGPSGCGKSTLLRTIAGLEDITSGDLLINDEIMNEVPPAERGVAMVFQSYALFPHMTVYENMSFGMRLAKLDPQLIDQRVQAAAKMLQLGAYLQRKPKALSGGQRQRVAIGRAIVREPGVFLFDEPLSNLDAALRVQTRFEIAKLHREFGQASTVYVTHDQVEAMTLADRILLLNTGDAVSRFGSVAQHGTPFELYHRPNNQFVAGFIGSPKMNFVSAKVVGVQDSMLQVQLSSGELLDAHVKAAQTAVGDMVTLGIRPEHMALGDATQHIKRRVLWQEHLGEATHVYLDSDQCSTGMATEDSWMIKVTGHGNSQTGDSLAVSLPASALHVFDSFGLALERSISDADLKAPMLVH
jgi:multiple sugar transport system ATP-binding protein